MAKFPSVTFEVKWRPFQLNPYAPKEGVNKQETYDKKFGKERVQMMLPRLQQAFRQVGVEMSMGGNTGNTMDSHRLLTWAGNKGITAQNALVEELFKNYFSEEKYIGDRTILLEAAESVGLDKTEAAEVIDDPEKYKKEVAEQMRKFAAGVSGVPFFFINGEPALSGAQPPEAFEEIFSEVVNTN
mmetsp:Transcript_19629/g.30749  ORF Transcript_19629/g.30749 Transcript_19629/m.30749 type:complete len:185 (-) Transcript_19629:417-971(-)